MPKSLTKFSETFAPKHGSSTPIRLIKMPEVMHRTTYGKAWIYRLIAQGCFPQPVKIGSRSIAFVESDIDDWISQRIAESRGE
ncbi:AlpA family transcriptional regulator [Citrobacter sp. R56]|nr:AlpA family transcriptional regulator [Citrobacter sp. R56]